MFDTIDQRLRDPSLELVYHLAPWDQPVFQANTATISSIRVEHPIRAARAFDKFRDYCLTNDVKLVVCRLPQDRLAECAFLEAQGFRFIELNYRPVLIGLEQFAGDSEIDISPADLIDMPEIAGFAARIFETGRLHVDPQVNHAIGDRRYAAWVRNAFANPAQHVLKCSMAGRMIAFMVVEHPTPISRFWSLVGLAPGLTGQGLGRRVWQTMLAFHHREGVQEVSTSISSHNIAVHNLYASLGFRFPAPAITLHWCPFGPIKLPVHD